MLRLPMPMLMFSMFMWMVFWPRGCCFPIGKCMAVVCARSDFKCYAPTPTQAPTPSKYLHLLLLLHLHLHNIHLHLHLGLGLHRHHCTPHATPQPHTLHPTPYTQRPPRSTLRPTPITQHPTHYTHIYVSGRRAIEGTV